ncbi:MAG: AmmeMemoRadiSam system protein A, partial [Coriobacteriales bacterium]|nr:AmmeMemoRadiSam system protein A [Coriobacteriales bacterium]
SDLPEDLLRTRAGCFVSLKVDGQLRGCIGTILPTQRNLAQEICTNAISAGTRDPRFSAVRADELDDLVYDVDVLTTPEPTTREGLDPARYGVIVSCPDGRRGLLLPDLDGVDTVSEQVRIAAQKGRIDLDFDNYRLERFEVVRHL